MPAGSAPATAAASTGASPPAPGDRFDAPRNSQPPPVMINPTRPPGPVPGAVLAAGEPVVISKTAEPNAPVKDNQVTTSTIQIDDDAKAKKLTLDLDIGHTYRGDLVVTLTSPSGKQHVISNREGGSADNLQGSFDLSAAFADEPVKGEWKLTVEDKARIDEGTLKTWGLKIETGETEEPPPPPVNEDSDPMKHLEFFASDEMRGRDTPSPELDKASAYVRDFLQKYGLEGPNPNDPQSPYYQTFDMFGFAGAGVHHDEHPEGEPVKFGNDLFERGFYLDENMSQEDVDLIAQRYQESGALGPRPDIQSVDDLRQVAQLQGQTQNTMGLLRGTGPHKDEVIVVMAHLDHVGVDRQGRPYNGASDNASGSATILSSIPKLVEMQKAGQLDRSILFVWTAGEEQGLVGAKYFADHPLPGLGSKEIVGVVNTDMVGRWDDQRLSVIDSNSNGRTNYFHDIVENANKRMEDPFDRINHDINQFRDRQDGAIFTRKGEDVLFLFEGLSNPNGGGSLIPEYHRQDDDVNLIYRDNGGNKPRRIRDLLVNILEAASNRQVQGETRSPPPAESVAWN
jgi:subtilisin-like proprotein convertase family protein